MRSSTILATLFATLAAASPVHHALQKKAIVYDWTTEVVTITVTEGSLPASTPVEVKKVVNTVYVDAVEQSAAPQAPAAPPAPPAPTSSSSPPPPPPAAPAPAPATSASYEPAPVPTPSAPAPAASSPVSSGPTGLSKMSVDYHNECRAKHSVSNVNWDDEIANAAQELANSCTNEHDVTIGGGGYGQNIGAVGHSNSDGYTLDSSLQSVMESWYSEGEAYGPYYGQAQPPSTAAKGTDQIDILHFTQMVWKGTGSIGCGVAACPKGKIFDSSMYSWFVVCNYKAPGNYGGEYAANVFA